MVKATKINKEDIGVVYDISLDGTVVNALGMNVISNTDGFNFKMPHAFRYTDEHPYISNGRGRNSKEGKAYVGVYADVAEFEDLYFNTAYNGGVNKSGLGIDEFCDACIQFSRKNYADLMPDGSIKRVGNTIKSRKMSSYLEDFISDGVSLLLHGKGYEFLESYYHYIERIYNYQIPIKDIAAKGNIKKSLKEYKDDCMTVTKSGSKKARQAWYELAIRDGLNVNVGDAVYYINTGKKKGDSDVKRVTHYYYTDADGDDVCVDKEFKKAFGNYEGHMKSDEFGKEMFGRSFRSEDEIILNCRVVPSEIMDSEEDILCDEYDGLEYNVEKYIAQFNNKVKPLLVCFSNDIRDKILITNPKDRKSFTVAETELVSGHPYKEEDQDTYEALMTPEDNEVAFWLKVGEVPPFVEDCGIDWDSIVARYEQRKAERDGEIFARENEKYLDAVSSLTKKDITEFLEEGKIPASLTKIMKLGSDLRFYFKELPNVTPSDGGYIFDVLSLENLQEESEE